ncbi:MltA-interacting protein precursor [Microbulbifer aggregans]|uniref:MltA-interacting protein n=1 Tax=Microbulbifer aggregans TaxID=1769779 RepID=A0A1C9W980_9GAMM|nr:MipA/OmpV family protein [Microbulbifer aggregans]AOS97724.1 MltA-interacting protein precursor [Microbulbifer aggregans]
MKTLLVALALFTLFRFSSATAAEITVRLQNPPPEGSLVLQVYDSPDAFGDFRRPAREMRYAIQAGETYLIPDAPAGQVAVLVYVDENNNRALDRSFIGIPREPLGLSNNYQPKGPPSFQRASFSVEEGRANYIDIELYSVLGDAGQWGVGLGAVGRSSPYVGSDTSVVQVIPAITYFGERLQWVGPNLRYGIAGSDRLRLAVTASYRVGAYEEDDSSNLQGLGDRDSTVMLGIGLIYEGPYGIEFDLGYENDVLDNVGGGGNAVASVSRGFQFGNIRLNPALGVNWISSSLADYDFGVPQSAALPGRPAYDVGSSITVEAGVGALWELSENWRIALNVAWENLDSEITDSPIVDEDYVIKGFTALTYTF